MTEENKKKLQAIEAVNKQLIKTHYAILGHLLSTPIYRKVRPFGNYCIRYYVGEKKYRIRHTIDLIGPCIYFYTCEDGGKKESSVRPMEIKVSDRGVEAFAQQRFLALDEAFDLYTNYLVERLQP